MGPWIESLVGQSLGRVDEFKARQGSFMRIYHDTHPIDKFTLSPTTEIVGFSLMNEEEWFVFKCSFEFWVFGKFCMKLWKKKMDTMYCFDLPTPINKLNNVRNRKFWVSRFDCLRQGYITRSLMGFYSNFFSQIWCHF